MKKILLLLLVFCLVGCQNKPQIKKFEKVDKKQDVFYEIFVASFNDSNQDKMGDLNGITQKLDYLDEMGISGIWLMPIHPSDTYHKYDVKDYKAIDPAYGTMQDFENLVAEAKKRNIKIIIDLVLNHTAYDHPWFLDAKNQVNCTKCDYYNFSNNQQVGYAKLDDKTYYEARFWEKMPDLNLENPKVRNEIKDIVEFWLDKGVAGFRLDAVAHYFDESLEKSNEFTNWLTTTVKNKNKDAILVGEVWRGEESILSYYPSKIDSLFDFGGSELNGRIVKLANREKGKQLAQETIAYNQKIKKINENSFNSTFISNHDQPRSAGYLNDDESKKLISALYILSPGVPFIYYGEEIGLKGSGKDENKRLALTWGENNDANSPKDSDYQSTHKQTIKEALADENSVLNFYKQVIRFKHLYTTKDIPTVVDVDEAIFGLQYPTYKILINTKEEAVTIDKIGEIVDQIHDVKVNGNQITLGKYAIVVLK